MRGARGRARRHRHGGRLQRTAGLRVVRGRSRGWPQRRPSKRRPHAGKRAGATRPHSYPVCHTQCRPNALWGVLVADRQPGNGCSQRRSGRQRFPAVSHGLGGGPVRGGKEGSGGRSRRLLAGPARTGRCSAGWPWLGAGGRRGRRLARRGDEALCHACGLAQPIQARSRSGGELPITPWQSILEGKGGSPDVQRLAERRRSHPQVYEHEGGAKVLWDVENHLHVQRSHPIRAPELRRSVRLVLERHHGKRKRRPPLELGKPDCGEHAHKELAALGCPPKELLHLLGPSSLLAFRAKSRKRSLRPNCPHSLGFLRAITRKHRSGRLQAVRLVGHAGNGRYRAASVHAQVGMLFNLLRQERPVAHRAPACIHGRCALGIPAVADSVVATGTVNRKFLSWVVLASCGRNRAQWPAGRSSAARAW